jgi:acetyl-CoA carboxylase carboxyltransferase component
MAHEKMLEELAARKAKALGMGGPDKLAKRAAQGVLDARSRLDLLLDAGSFVESGLFATSFRAEDRERTPADGKVAGFGRIDGREVGVVSNDFTVLGASSSQINGKKIKHVKDIANAKGLPMVFLGESAGARIPDRMGSAGRAILGQDPTEYQRIRTSPWVSAQLGACFGSSTWYGCMSDFVVMRKGALMAVASHRVTSSAISQEVDPEELGGWKLLTGVSGLVDVAVDTDAEAIDTVKRFLSYLPSNCNEAPPVLDASKVAVHDQGRLLEILPELRTKVYDARKLAEVIVDVDSLFEMKPKFGRSIVTALARIDGRTVGIIANNPMFKGGAIDVDACNKATSFLVFCDSFNVPIILMVDQPGFLIGLEGEKRGAAGRIINWMNALALVTVPKLSIIVRKSYGQAYLNMGGGRNSDEVAAWPTADLGFMDPKVGASVLAREGESTEATKSKSDSLVRDTTAWGLASLYEAHTVLDPRETRGWLAAMLDVHRSKLTRGVGQHRLANWPTSY